jgi:hypothetical protein
VFGLLALDSIPGTTVKERRTGADDIGSDTLGATVRASDLM